MAIRAPGIWQSSASGNHVRDVELFFFCINEFSVFRPFYLPCPTKIRSLSLSFYVSRACAHTHFSAVNLAIFVPSHPPNWKWRRRKSHTNWAARFLPSFSSYVYLSFSNSSISFPIWKPPRAAVLFPFFSYQLLPSIHPQSGQKPWRKTAGGGGGGGARVKFFYNWRTVATKTGGTTCWKIPHFISAYSKILNLEFYETWSVLKILLICFFKMLP